MESLSRENLKDKAYRIIKNKIISCEYQPNDFLSENALAKEIEVGRTPIREALNKLEQEQLVRIIPKKGTLVTGITYGEVKNIFEIRELLEPYIVRTYASRIDKEIILSLKEKFEEVKLKKSFSHSENCDNDDKFHKILFEASGNNYFINLFNSISDQNQRIRIISGKLNVDRIEETYDEHLKVIDYIIENDFEKAALAMEHHLKRSKLVGLKLFLDI